MKNYEFIIVNENLTEIKNQEKIIDIFNDKLATLFLMYEELALEGCNDTKVDV